MAKSTGTDDEKAGGKRSRWMILLAGLLVVAVAGSGWFFLLKPEPSTEPVVGEVMTLEPVQLNLASGHYLRVGLGLQLVEGADVNGIKALDAAITTFSGLPLSEVSLPDQRERLRNTLLAELDEVYEGDVLAVYFTEFVTQ
jgi:flagellar FliL protein